MKLKFIYLLLFLFSFIQTVMPQTGWFYQNPPLFHDYHSVHFINQDTGWVAGGVYMNGDGSIGRTTNGGTNWVCQWMGPNNYFYSVFFVDGNTGWAAGWQMNTAKGIIWKSNNGGISWFNQWDDSTGYCFTHVYFKNQNTGWVVPGHTGKMIYTTNGGNNWIQQSIGVPSVSSIFFIDQNTGWGVGGSDAIKTTNGGANWMNQSSPGTQLNSVFFINQNTGWACGYGMKKSTNGGTNWVSQPLSVTNLNSLFFTDQNNGWSVCGFFTPCYILHTSNGGSNWSTQSVSAEFLKSVFFVNQNTGWIVGSVGRILKTTTGGIPLEIKSISNSIPEEYRLYQNYPNPFNPITKIKFDTPPQPSPKGREYVVRLVIYDILGREIAVLVNEQIRPGTYEVEWDASNYPSGVYVYQLSADNFKEYKKMVLLK